MGKKKGEEAEDEWHDRKDANKMKNDDDDGVDP